MTMLHLMVKQLPESCSYATRRSFLREITQFFDSSRRPRLIVDLSAIEQIRLESIDLLLQCVVRAERGDGELFIAGASPETAVILELTQATSVLNIFPSVSKVADDRELHDMESLKQHYLEEQVA